MTNEHGCLPNQGHRWQEWPIRRNWRFGRGDQRAQPGLNILISIPRHNDRACPLLIL
jgi:hypothetical protein